MPQPAILPGPYRAGDRTIHVLFARGGMVRYWEITDPATANDPGGKTHASMTVERFQADGFSKVESPA